MKKCSFLAVLALIIVLSAAAQQSNPKVDESDLYYVNVPIEKIFPYSKGYAVIYRTGLTRVFTAYIPREWFVFAVHKAELHQMGSGRTRPSMVVYYKGGQFHMVKLYVSKFDADPTWGTITNSVNLDAEFEGVETVTLQF